MVELDINQLHDYSLGLVSGEYTSEEVVKFFRGVYGHQFSSHDLTNVCRLLGWSVVKRSGKSDFIHVK